MALWRRKKKEPMLEDRIFRLFARKGPMDHAQICVELGGFDKEKIKRAITSLVESGDIELRLDPGQAEDTEFMSAPWGLSTAIFNKVRKKRKAQARRVLRITPA